MPSEKVNLPFQRNTGVFVVVLLLSACWDVVHVIPFQPDDAGSTVANDGGIGAFNMVFVTPGKYQLGSLGDGDGGVPVADAICNSVGKDLGYPGQYVALLSTSKIDLRDRVPAGIHGWASPSGPVFDAPGSARMVGRIGLVGIPVAGKPPTWVATGSTNWGTYAGANCQDWTSADANVLHTVGDATELLLGWANAALLPCDGLEPIYCAQVNFSNGIPLAPAAGSLRVFVTEQRYSSGGGRTLFDQACAAEATAAGLGGTFKAYVSTQSVYAQNAENWGRAMRYRMDGALTTFDDTYESFNPLYLMPIQQTATGRTLVPLQSDWPPSPFLIRTDTAVWFGNVSDGATTCNDWFSTSGTGLAADATSLQGDHWNNFLLAPSTTRDCGEPAHLFCVEVP